MEIVDNFLPLLIIIPILALLLNLKETIAEKLYKIAHFLAAILLFYGIFIVGWTVGQLLSFNILIKAMISYIIIAIAYGTIVTTHGFSLLKKEMRNHEEGNHQDD